MAWIILSPPSLYLGNGKFFNKKFKNGLMPLGP
jgi:hypothetical protein